MLMSVHLDKQRDTTEKWTSHQRATFVVSVAGLLVTIIALLMR